MNEGPHSLIGADSMEDPHPILCSFFDGTMDVPIVPTDDGDRFGFKVASLFEGVPAPGSATKPKLEPFEGTLLSLLTSPVKMDYDALTHPSCTPTSHLSSFTTNATPQSSMGGTVTRNFLPVAPFSQPSPNFTSCSASPGLQPGRLFLSPPELQKTSSQASFEAKPHPILSSEEQSSEPSTAINLTVTAAPHPILASSDPDPSPRAHPIMSASPSEDNSPRSDVKPHPIFGSPEPPPPARPAQPQQIMRPTILTQGGKKRGRDAGITALGEDGFNWLKYGEKRLSSARRTRAYFRCSKSKELDCPAKKFVDILEEDPDGSNAMISYIQSHNHSKDCEAPLTSTSSGPSSSEGHGLPVTPRGVTVIGQLSAVASQKLSHVASQQPFLAMSNPCQMAVCSTPGISVKTAHSLVSSEQGGQRICL